jgi:hypothetical protein
MAFSFTKDLDTVVGNMRVTGGTFNGAAVTTGEIRTGLQQIIDFDLQYKAAAVVADAPVYNEVLPMAGTTAVTVVFTSGAVGRWRAWGS